MNRYLYLLPLLFLFLTSCITDDEPAATSLRIGDKCPDFSIVMNDGKTLSSADLQGKRSILVFFNTSCGDCRKELPVIQEVYDEMLAEKIDVNLLCISREESEESIQRFWQANNLTLPYSAQNDKKVYNLFASSIIPRIYILSPQLIITNSWNDDPMPTPEQILEALE